MLWLRGKENLMPTRPNGNAVAAFYVVRLDGPEMVSIKGAGDRMESWQGQADD